MLEAIKAFLTKIGTSYRIVSKNSEAKKGNFDQPQARQRQADQVAMLTGLVKSAKSPQLVITKFTVEVTDWLRFWNEIEAEIEGSEVAGGTNFSYLKELVKPKVKTTIEGLPFSTEGYEWVHTFLKKKFDKTSEIVNAYMQSNMALPTLPGSKS